MIGKSRFAKERCDFIDTTDNQIHGAIHFALSQCDQSDEIGPSCPLPGAALRAAPPGVVQNVI
jgi:hypothetical protein